MISDTVWLAVSSLVRETSFQTPCMLLMPNCTCSRALVQRLENGVDCNDRVVRWRGFVSPLVRGVVGCHSVHLPRTQEICPHPLAKDVKVKSICHDMMKMEGDCMSLASHPLFLEAFLEANSYPYCRYSTACNGWSGYQTCLHGKSLVPRLCHILLATCTRFQINMLTP